MRELHPLAVVVPYWLGRPAIEALEVVHAADAAGVPAAWIGEMLSFDAFVLAGALARETDLHLTVGPLAVGVRTPVGIAMGVAGLQALAGAHRVAVALGASTRVVTEDWHGREWSDMPRRLAETTEVVRSVLAGERSDSTGSVPSRGFRLGIPATVPEIGIAAFGPRATEVAARHADRLVLNLVTEEQAAAQASQVPAGTPVTAWIVAALEPTPATMAQMRRQLAMYVGAPGYGEMFTRAGFGFIVDRARDGVPHGEVVSGIPDELLQSVGMIGSHADIEQRLAAYRSSGITQVAMVPATADDRAGSRTLRAIAGMA